MENHVKVLGILNVVYGGMGLLGGLISVLVLGGTAGILQAVAQREPDAWIAASIVGTLALIVFVLVTVLSIPCIVAGYGLLSGKSWGVMFALVISAINLLNIPIGTCIGGYGLWVLFRIMNERSASPTAGTG